MIKIIQKHIIELASYITMESNLINKNNAFPIVTIHYHVQHKTLRVASDLYFPKNKLAKGMHKNISIEYQ